MRCDRCNENIEEGEEKELHGQTLYEDCYRDTSFLKSLKRPSLQILSYLG